MFVVRTLPEMMLFLMRLFSTAKVVKMAFSDGEGVGLYFLLKDIVTKLTIWRCIVVLMFKR